MKKKGLTLLLGLILGISLVLCMGAYDKTVYVGSTITYDDDTSVVWGTGSDATMTWDNSNSEVDLTAASGNLDLNLAGYATMDFTAATDHTGGFKVTTNIPTGQDLYGGIYTHAHLEGTTDGTVAALRVKTSMDSDSAPAAYVYGARITVEEAGADQSSGIVCPLIIETYCDAAGDDPSAHYMMRFNTTIPDEVPSAWFIAGNSQAVAFTANTTHTSASTDKIGAIKIHIAGPAGGDCYLYVYSHAGQ